MTATLNNPDRAGPRPESEERRMTDVTTKCNQQGCEEPAVFRFTWPGRDEAGICEKHAPQLRGIANAMGMYLQLIPLDNDTAARGAS